MQFENFKPLITWLHMHPHWGGILSFLVAFTESIAIFGLIIPGSVVMSAIGILIGSKVLPMGSTMIAAMLGAFLGDVLSYWFGYYYRYKIHDIWPFYKVPSWLSRGESFFASHGGKGIFVGRFIGPIRPILPLIAGSMAMPALRFHVVDFLSSILWAPTYMLPGILIGAASLELPAETASKLVFYLLVLLVLLWLLFWILKKIIIKFFIMLNYSLTIFWQLIIKKSKGSKYSWAQFFQLDPDPKNKSQLIIFIFFIFFLLAFIAFTIVVAHIKILMPLNFAIANFFKGIYHPSTQKIMITIALLFDGRVICLLWLILSFYFFWKKQTTHLVYWLTFGCFAIGLIGLLQHLIYIPQAQSMLHTFLGGSYPSGYVCLATALLGFLTFIICYRRKRIIYWLSFSILILLILINSFARLYLGFDWISDIFGAYLLAITLILGSIFIYRRQLSPMASLKNLVLISFISISLIWALLIWKDFNKEVDQYNRNPPFISLSITKWWQFGLDNQPLYRFNPFGKPVQTMNIEWLGNISEIKQLLLNQGWKIKPKNALISTVTYLSVKDHSKVLPLFPIINGNKKPKLLMSILVGKPKKLLILRLWPSHIFLVDAQKDEKLWIGTINYQKSKNSNKLTLPYFKLDSVTNVFQKYLSSCQYKILDYSNHAALNNKIDKDWDGHVLLISSWPSLAYGLQIH